LVKLVKGAEQRLRRSRSKPGTQRGGNVQSLTRAMKILGILAEHEDRV